MFLHNLHKNVKQDSSVEDVYKRSNRSFNSDVASIRNNGSRIEILNLESQFSAVMLSSNDSQASSSKSNT